MNQKFFHCFAIGIFAIVFSVSSVPIARSMTSTNYEIRFDQIGSGGDDTSSSGSYLLRDSMGGRAIDPSTSTSYDLGGGYREGIFDEVATFTLHAQNTGTQVAASSIASNVITVTSSAGYATGDMIAVVRNEGATQNGAVGKVTATGAGTITVDALSPGTPTIDGTDDYVYNLSSSSISLGSLSDSAVSTAILAWEVDADVDEGYGVYVFEDEDLRTGDDLNTITDVLDGTVSPGTTEYGARSSDTTLATSTFDTADTAISTTLQLIGSRSAFGFDSRDFLTFKASIDGDERDAGYSHNVTVIYVGDY